MILEPVVSLTKSDSIKQIKTLFQKNLQKGCQANKSVEIDKFVSLATMDTMLRCSLSYQGMVQELG